MSHPSHKNMVFSCVPQNYYIFDGLYNHQARPHNNHNGRKIFNVPFIIILNNYKVCKRIYRLYLQLMCDRQFKIPGHQ